MQSVTFKVKRVGYQARMREKSPKPTLFAKKSGPDTL